MHLSHHLLPSGVVCLLILFSNLIYSDQAAASPGIIEGDNGTSGWWRTHIVTGLITIISAVVLYYMALSSRRRVKDETDDDYKQENDFLSKCEIGFEDIQMTLHQKKKKGDRLILDGSIKGNAHPGRMLAIMGPSGSGKTTLLHALAGRIVKNKRLTLTGRRYINDVPLAGDTTIPCAFIEQDSNFFPHMTVQETLDFRVKLKRGKQMGTSSARDDIVSDLMKDLSLTKSANTIVGNSKIRGLSGGERKRLSIACEMISSPSLVFLDEPTSGLDSYQATQVVQTMRGLADRGKTIITVIHQPSQKVFSMFDDLLLVSEGKQMYFGDVKRVRHYFEKIGYPCSDEVGTAEHVIDCISAVSGDNENAAIGDDVVTKSHQRLDDIAKHALIQAKDIVVAAKVISNDKGSKGIKLRRFHDPEKERPSANVFQQFKLLLGRSLHEVFRGKGAIAIKIVQQVSVAFIYGGIYHLGNNQASIMDRFGLLSLVVIGAVNMGVATTIRTFPKEKTIVSAELSSHLYGTLPYFVAKAISEFPLAGFFSAIFGFIVYPLVGLQKGRFQNFLGITALSSLTAISAGLLVGSISANEDVALALFPPILVLNIIFDGKNISMENTPMLLRWIPKISLIRWAFEGLAINEFEGLEFESSSGPFKGPMTKTGEEALEKFNIVDLTIVDTVWAQLYIVAVCWFLSYLGLSLTRQKFQVMKNPDK